MSLFPGYRQPKQGQKFFISNVDMRCSFDSLKDLAIKKVGADFEKGDICYFENSNSNRRKVLLQKEGIVFQLYWMKIKGRFIPIKEQDGLLKRYVDFKE